MLSQHETELLCRVGPGTPMGELLRRFWTPVLLSEELPAPDCDPVAVRIMGEDLVAFRNSAGTTALLSAYCPHRHAHLFWGRNEENGLRCSYHGWKFDTDGSCVDMPNEPPESRFREKVSVRAYPTREAGGCVWAYMGPPDLMPAELPQLEWTRVPSSQRFTTKRLQLSNWAQAVEGGIDSSHVSFLHSRTDSQQISMPSAATGGLSADDNRTLSLAFKDRSPRFWTTTRDFGFLVAARRNTPDDQFYWRLTPFLLPFYTIIPSGDQPGRNLGGHAWVPVDDEHVWTFTITWNAERALTEDELAAIHGGMGIHADVDKNQSMWELASSNGYVPLRNRGNNYQIDRALQRTQTFTGIQGISEQDMSIQESMGRISPRREEHLGTTDKAIIEVRKLLIKLARDLLEGKEPDAPSLPQAYQVRSAAFVLAPEIEWEEGCLEYIKARV